MRASIIVLTYNQLDDGTRPCIESLYRYTDPEDFELICVDNASVDGTPDFLKGLEKKYNNIKILLNDTNRGFAGGNNDGMRLATGDVIILLNNDTLVTPHWLEALLAPMASDRSIGLIGPITNSAGNEQMVTIPGLNEANHVEMAGQYVHRQAGYTFETEKLGFYCVAMSKEVLLRVGYLDEKFGIGMFEDDDYCVRVRKEGFRLVINEGCFIYHKGSLSFKKIVDEEFQSMFARNRDYFVSKHGGDWLFNDITMAFFRQMEREVRAQQVRGLGAVPEVERVSVRLNGFRYLIENARNIERRSVPNPDRTKPGEHRFAHNFSLFINDFLRGDGRSRKLFVRMVYRSITPLTDPLVIDRMGEIRRTDPFHKVVVIPDGPDYHGSEEQLTRTARTLARAGQLVVYETWNHNSDTVEVADKVEDRLYLMNQNLIGFLPHLAKPEEVVLLATRPSSVLSIDRSLFSTVVLDLTGLDLNDVLMGLGNMGSAAQDKVVLVLVGSNDISKEIAKKGFNMTFVLDQGIRDENVRMLTDALGK